MAIHTLPLDPVVNVKYELSAVSAVRNKFDLACLMGDIGAAVDFGNKRIKTYTGTDEMLQDGFTLNDRLYKAAALIFGQSHSPNKVAIGKVEKTKDKAEEPVKTFQACREENGEWYIGIYCDAATDEQLLACADYVASCKPYTIMAYTTQNAKAWEESGIFAKMKAKGYRRVIGQYSSKDPNAIAAVIGWAMGTMSGTVNSAYTLAYKQEVGVAAENSEGTFASSKVEAIKKANGNVYINRGSYYNVFEEGKMADGTWFDEIIFLDKYANDMQLALMDVLYKNNKVEQTESGMNLLKNQLVEICNEMNRIGFIKPGDWKAKDMLNLKYGDTLPGGYLIQSDSIDEQVQADRENRIAPAIYVCLKLAGAIHHVTVSIPVNR